MARVVIFDFDGVIADTEKIHLRAFRRALAPMGIKISERDYYGKYLALDDKTFFSVLLTENGFEVPAEKIEKLVREKSAAVLPRMGECVFFEGAENLIRSLAEKIPLAIASGALRQEILCALSIKDLKNCFSFIASAEDCERCKPDPEIFIRALSGLNDRLKTRALKNAARPSECAVIEDSPHGVAAAKSAGMKCVAVCNSHPPQALSQADLIVSSALELNAETLAGF